MIEHNLFKQKLREWGDWIGTVKNRTWRPFTPGKCDTPGKFPFCHKGQTISYQSFYQSNISIPKIRFKCNLCKAKCILDKKEWCQLQRKKVVEPMQHS